MSPRGPRRGALTLRLPRRRPARAGSRPHPSPPGRKAAERDVDLVAAGQSTGHQSWPVAAGPVAAGAVAAAPVWRGPGRMERGVVPVVSHPSRARAWIAAVAWLRAGRPWAWPSSVQVGPWPWWCQCAATQLATWSPRGGGVVAVHSRLWCLPRGPRGGGVVAVHSRLWCLPRGPWQGSDPPAPWSLSVLERPAYISSTH